MSKKRPEPFKLLQTLDELCREHSFDLPKLEEQVASWSGVVFKLHGETYIAPLSEVAEIMDIPKMSNVPGAKSWVRGIANVRGTLLPIMDLQGFLYNLPNRSRAQRLLVIHQGDFLSSIVVDEVIGLQHFEDFERSQDLPEIDEEVGPYIDDGFSRGDQVWPVFKLSILAEDLDFLQVAI
jgi:twitching motility protein PilI